MIYAHLLAVCEVVCHLVPNDSVLHVYCMTPCRCIVLQCRQNKDTKCSLTEPVSMTVQTAEIGTTDIGSTKAWKLFSMICDCSKWKRSRSVAMHWIHVQHTQHLRSATMQNGRFHCHQDTQDVLN